MKSEMQFEKLAEAGDIEVGKEHLIPVFNLSAPTHIGARKGKISFFVSNSGLETYKSGKRWRYWLIPDGVKAYCFSGFKWTAGGWVYGQPTWCF